MKKIIEEPKKKKKSKKTQMSSALKKIFKTYKNKPEEQDILVPSIFDTISKLEEEPEKTGIEPLPIGSEREYLAALLKEEDYNILKVQLNYFSNIFTDEKLVKTGQCSKCSAKITFTNPLNSGSKTKCPYCKVDFIVETKNKDIDVSYKKIIKSILTKYDNMETIKYIIKLFLNQYALTLKDFYDKFLTDPTKFSELKQLRKLFLKIIKNTNLEKGLDENTLESIRLQLKEFKEKYPRYNDKYRTIYETINKTGNILLSFTKTPELPKTEGVREEILSPLSIIITDFDINLTSKFIKEFLDQSHQDLHEFYKEFMTDDMIKAKINKYKGIIYVPPEKQIIIPKYTVDDTINMNVDLQNCISMYSMLPWIPEKIKRIYICKVDIDISNYIVKLGVPLNIEGEDWYRVSKKYYNLQCDTNYYKKQIGNVLNFFNKKTDELVINFKIGYEVESTGKKSKNKINIIIQDEELYKREIEYINKKNKTPQQKINEMLDRPVNTDIKDKAFKNLQNLFVIERNNGIETIATNKYIKDLVDEIDSQTNTLGEFVKKLSEIAVYLSRSLDAITFGLFKTNIELNLYEPKDLLNLTQKEKLPEVFGDNFMFEGDKEKIQDEINKNLLASLNEFGENFVDNLYISMNPYTNFKPRNINNVGYRFRYDFKNNIKDWRLDCENKLTNVDKNSLGLYISYTDNAKKYCLNIKDIIKNFNKKDFTNPFTGNIFTNDFITTINKYNKYTVEPEIVNLNVPIISSVEDSLTPGLLDFIRADIIRMSDLNDNIDNGCGCNDDGNENYDEEFIIGDINDLESLDSRASSKDILQNDSQIKENIFLEELKSFDDYNNTNLAVEEDSGHHKDLDIEDEDSGHHKDLDTEDEESGQHKDLDTDTDTEVETDSENEDSGQHKDLEYREDIEIPSNSLTKSEYLKLIDDSKYIMNNDNNSDGKKCKKCNIDIDIGYKSLEWNNENEDADHIEFCSLKCMEDYEWPKYKKKKKNKNKKI